jgi:hypothetical protein
VAGISAGPVLVLLGVDHLLLRSMGYAECGRVLQEFLYNHHGCVDRLQVALATSSVVVGLAGLVAGTAVLIRRSRRRSAPPPSG